MSSQENERTKLEWTKYSFHIVYCRVISYIVLVLVELTKNYVDAINSGAVLTISTAWDSVVQQECQKALTLAMKTYETR